MWHAISSGLSGTLREDIMSVLFNTIPQGVCSDVRLPDMDDYDGKKNPVPVAVTTLPSFTQPSPRRPPINYSSPPAFFKSVGARWRSVWTKRFILSLVFGQIVSLCITCTNVTTTELVNRGLSLPTMQNNLL